MSALIFATVYVAGAIAYVQIAAEATATGRRAWPANVAALICDAGALVWLATLVRP